MANLSTSSPAAKEGNFNRMYFLILVAAIVLVLGLFLFFASTRQSHGSVSPAGTQKGMIVLGGNATAV